MRPRRGGALIDRIDAWECTTPLSVVVVRDQQGWPRPQDSDGDGVAGCEPGAYELPYDPTLMRDGFERPFARRR